MVENLYSEPLSLRSLATPTPRPSFTNGRPGVQGWHMLALREVIIVIHIASTSMTDRAVVVSPRLFDHSLLSASTSVDIFDVLLSSSFILFVSLLGSFRIFQARESLKWREIASFSPGAGWSHLLHHWWWWRYHLRKSSRCPKKCSLWLL